MILPQILLTVAMALGVTARTFDDCTLLRELRRVGALEEDLPDWMCLIEYGSTFNSSAVGALNEDGNADGSEDWGLFQVNDKWWCKAGSKPSENACNIACEDLLSDDIKAAFDCALKVKEKHGFKGWVTWVNRCRHISRRVTSCN